MMDTMFDDMFHSTCRRHLSASNIIILIIMSFHSDAINTYGRTELPAGKSSSIGYAELSLYS